MFLLDAENKADYIRLGPIVENGLEEDEEDEELLVQETLRSRNNSKRRNTTVKLRIFIALAIVFSGANFLFCVRQYLAMPPSSTMYGSRLPLASSYINISAGCVSQNFSIDNMPLVVGTVDRKRPNSVRPDETPHWASVEGMVIPDRRHILISESISTIVQFRAREFGLEVCQPTIVLPTFASLIGANSTVPSENDKQRTYEIQLTSWSQPRAVQIHVWLLESMTPDGVELEIDLTSLSFAGLPRRKLYLGTINAQEGERSTADSFACASASLNTIELSCDSPGCLVDFWSDDMEPRMSFFISQSSY